MKSGRSRIEGVAQVSLKLSLPHRHRPRILECFGGTADIASLHLLHNPCSCTKSIRNDSHHRNEAEARRGHARINDEEVLDDG